MANTISNFLVGIGFDFDEKGAKEATSSIDGLKSTALQATGVLAGAFGAKALTADFAAMYDSVGKFSEVFGVVPEDVMAFGRALEHEGGSLAGFMSQLEGIEKLRAGLLTGDADWLAKVGTAGIDPTVITSAKDATEAYANLADQFERMGTQERLNAASALGLDEASIRLLSKGRDELDAIIAREINMRPVTEKMTEEAARFNDEWQDLWTRIGGASDRASMQILPAVNDIIAGMGDWLDVNQEFINQGVDDIFGFVAEHLDSIAVAAGLLATSGFFGGFAGLAKALPGIGGGLSGIAGTLGKISGYAAVGYGAYEVVKSAAPGEALSATSLFGENDVTNFLDMPIGELFDSIFGDNKLEEESSKTLKESTITPQDVEQASSYRASRDEMLSENGDYSSRASGGMPATRTLQPIVLQLDKKVLADTIIEVTNEEAKKGYEESKSPYKG